MATPCTVCSTLTCYNYLSMLCFCCNTQSTMTNRTGTMLPQACSYVWTIRVVEAIFLFYKINTSSYPFPFSWSCMHSLPLQFLHQAHSECLTVTSPWQSVKRRCHQTPFRACFWRCGYTWPLSFSHWAPSLSSTSVTQSSCCLEIRPGSFWKMSMCMAL